MFFRMPCSSKISKKKLPWFMNIFLVIPFFFSSNCFEIGNAYLNLSIYHLIRRDYSILDFYADGKLIDILRRFSFENLKSDKHFECHGHDFIM